MRIGRFGTVALLALLAACASTPSTASLPPPTAPTPTSSTPSTLVAPPTSGATTPTTSSTTGPPDTTGPQQGDTVPDPALQPLVDRAVADLTGRLGDVEIAVVSAEAVTWPDTSYGCPQPGMAYTQVLTDGTRIILEAEGRRYDYHTGPTADIFLCEGPS